MKDFGLVAEPEEVDTTTGPLDAPTGTTTTILVAWALTMNAGTALNVTWVTPPNLLPQIWTRAPTGAPRGFTCAIRGGRAPCVRCPVGETDGFGVVGVVVVPAPVDTVVVVVPPMAWAPGAPVFPVGVVGVVPDPSARGTVVGTGGGAETTGALAVPGCTALAAIVQSAFSLPEIFSSTGVFVTGRTNTMHPTAA
jgi:hypothetical protein